MRFAVLNNYPEQIGNPSHATAQMAIQGHHAPRRQDYMRRSLGSRGFHEIHARTMKTSVICLNDCVVHDSYYYRRRWTVLLQLITISGANKDILGPIRDK